MNCVDWEIKAPTRRSCGHLLRRAPHSFNVRTGNEYQRGSNVWVTLGKILTMKSFISFDKLSTLRQPPWSNSITWLRWARFRSLAAAVNAVGERGRVRSAVTVVNSGPWHCRAWRPGLFPVRTVFSFGSGGPLWRTPERCRYIY